MPVFVCALIGSLIGLFWTEFEPAGLVVGLVVGLCVGLVVKERRQEAAARKQPDPAEPARGDTAGTRPQAAPFTEPAAAAFAGDLRHEVDALKEEVARLRRDVQRLALQVEGTENFGDLPGEAPAVEPAVQAAAEPAPFDGLDRDAAYTVHEPVLRVDMPEDTEAAAPEPGEDPEAAVTAETFPEEPEAAPEQEIPAPVPTREPVAAEPSLAAKILGWFTQGNTMVRVGVVVLFFGLAFLLKYAADRDIFPLEYRLITAGVFGLGLLGLGWWMRRKRPDFALPVQGGGVAVFYLTALAAAKLYTVLPPSAAFAFMAGICALSTILAVLQRDQIMALLSFTGGRLAPLLLSTGEGNHIFLFSFYAVLTLGEIAILRFLPWRLLTLVSFFFTAGVGAIWGLRSYTPEFFPEAEGFLLLFFTLYAGISIFLALKGPRDRLRFCDAMLVFSVPVIAGAMQWFLLRDTEFGMAFSCLGLGAFYLGLAGLLRSRSGEGRAFLFDSALTLGVAAITLAVPFALSRDLTAAAWCVEGAALAWIGSRLRRPEGTVTGLLLQVVAGGLYLMMLGRTALDTLGAGLDPLMPMYAEAPVILIFANKLFVGGVLLTLAGLVSCRAMSLVGPEPESSGPGLAARIRAALWPFGQAFALPAFWALFWWCFAGVSELNRHLGEPRITALLGFLILTTAGIFAWSRLPRMDKARRVAALLIPVFLLLAARHAVSLEAFFPDTGRPWYELVAWLPALAFGWYALRRVEASIPSRLCLEWLHVGLVWTVCLLAGSEFVSFVAREVPEGVWRVCAGGVAPAVFLLALCRLAPRPAWPVGAFERAYLGIAPLPLAGFLALWLFLCLWGRGDPSPLPYMPLLNPLDLTLALGITALIVWVRALRTRGIAPIPLPKPMFALFAVAIGLFLWWNVALLRGLHHLGGFGFSLDAFLADRALQKCLAAGWVVFTAGLLGFSRKGERRKAALFAAVPILGLTFFWAVLANWSDGGGRFGAVPFFNPLDIIQIAAFALVVRVWSGVFRDCLERSPQLREKLLAGGIGAGLAVFWLHAVLLRTLHHWLGIPFELGALLRSEQVQAAISVFWTLLAVGPILYSKRKKVRAAWFLGAGLLALTVCKLFLVDLSNLSGLERVFSFIGVGVVLLLIGWLCPLPPRGAAAEEERKE